eukprot:6974916-Pyramimonas_sp.AAC.1
MTAEMTFKDSDAVRAIPTHPLTPTRKAMMRGKCIPHSPHLVLWASQQDGHLELCGGSGGISQLASGRGLSIGGNLGKPSFVDFGSKDVQDAVTHYLDICFANVVILQPSCRTTGLPSNFNAQ